MNQPNVIAVILSNGVIQFTGEQFEIGALMDANTNITMMIRGQSVRPQVNIPQRPEEEAEEEA